jgi:hypothetical protein
LRDEGFVIKSLDPNWNSAKMLDPNLESISPDPQQLYYMEENPFYILGIGRVGAKATRRLFPLSFFHLAGKRKLNMTGS